MMELLRNHGGVNDKWSPDRSLTDWTICMHKGFGPIRTSQTVGSIVSRISREGDTHWITVTSAPCTSIFMPVWIESGLPDFGGTPSNTYDKNIYWWQHEILHREIIKDFSSRISNIKDERDQLEKKYIEKGEILRERDNKKKYELTNTIFNEIKQIKIFWLDNIKKSRRKNRNCLCYEYTWGNINRKARFYS